MSIVNAIYNLLIGPLELLFEVIFSLANRVLNHPGLTLIFLSLAVNFLVLPLYKQADAMQEQARETEANLHGWVTHIKKYFKGDERFMILQAYYRENHYKPTDALRGSMSLLLEVPFFMAAYNFLFKLPLLQGVSFGPIQDLGEDLKDLCKRLQALYSEVYDLAETVRDKREAFDFSPEELDAAESRADQLYRLKKKYGATVEDCIAYLEQCRSELNAIETAHDTLLLLEQNLIKEKAAVLKAGAELTAIRKTAASALAGGANAVVLRHPKSVETIKTLVSELA